VVEAEPSLERTVGRSELDTALEAMADLVGLDTVPDCATWSSTSAPSGSPS
jgi:hypothetical protein